MTFWYFSEKDHEKKKRKEYSKGRIRLVELFVFEDFIIVLKFT